MSISAEERFLIEETLRIAEARTTHMVPEFMDNPIAKYTDPKQYEAEVNTLFRNFPIIIGHVSDLAEAGDFITHDYFGVPILVTRAQDGNVRAFLNVCRHRGAKLTKEPCGKARTLSCPYHAWTYSLDGKLRGIPQAFGFEGVDKSKRGLVELPVFNRFGLIWVVPSVQDHTIDIDTWLQPMAEQMTGLDMSNQHVYRKWTLEKKMSWRFLLEAFQESYHFCYAHRDTACAGYLNNRNVQINFDPHVRHAVPLPKVLDLHDQNPDTWDYRSNFMTQNYIFPANFVQVMTDHIYIHTIIPTGIDTRVFQCMMLINEVPQTEKAERYFQKNYDLIRQVFEEDFEIGEGIQAGLHSGANTGFIFGTYECGLHFGQKAIDAALAGKIRI